MGTPRVWKTQDGRKVKIKDMEDSHLLNSYKMLKRKGFIDPETLYFYLYGPQPNGDGAQMAYEQEQKAVFGSPVSSFVGEFEKELIKRKIKIPDVEPEDKYADPL